MQAVVVQQTLQAAASAVWPILRRGDSLERWFPAVESCELLGEGVGARRTCVIGGHELQERLVTIDNDAMVLQYAIERQQLLPISRVLGTMMVSPSGDTPEATCVVTWLLNFDIADTVALPAVRDAVTELYAGGLRGLERAAISARVHGGVA